MNFPKQTIYAMFAFIFAFVLLSDNIYFEFSDILNPQDVWEKRWRGPGRGYQSYVIGYVLLMACLVGGLYRFLRGKLFWERSESEKKGD